jgi:hypothetical protein
MKQTITPKLVGPKVAAGHIGIGYSSFRHAVRRGLFPYYQFGGTKLFKLEELDAASELLSNSPTGWRTAISMDFPRFTSTEPNRRFGKRSSARTATAGHSISAVSQTTW